MAEEYDKAKDNTESRFNSIVIIIIISSTVSQEMDDSDESNISTFTQRKPAKNGFLKFLREYSSKKYGMDLVEMSLKGGEAWSKLTNKQKEKYQSTPIEIDEWDQKEDEPSGDDDNADEGGSDACCPTPSCPKKRKPRSCCPKPKRKSCAKPKRKSCCKPKRKPACRPKPRCCKPKPRCCKPKPCCPKPKPCCPKRKPSCVPACQRPGPITNNGYLNFLRIYRQKHCGLKPRELVMRAARAWCRLPECKKENYRRLVQ